jgi:hypothetical protein
MSLAKYTRTAKMSGARAGWLADDPERLPYYNLYEVNSLRQRPWGLVRIDVCCRTWIDTWSMLAMRDGSNTP